MVLSHVVDAWTREADRDGWVFWTVTFVGGLGAPLFMLLAGVALAMAAGGVARREGVAAGAARARRRGWQIFGLAFLFRLQALVLGWGDPITLLTVDILNVMGLSMVAGSWLWQVAPPGSGRIAVTASAAVVVAALTPTAWTMGWPGWVPDVVRWYAQPTAGHTNFTLLPWAAFLFAGVAVGETIAGAARSGTLPRAHGVLLACGVALVAAGWAGAWAPPVFPGATYWGSSPAFFALRLGIGLTLIAAAWGHYAFWHGIAPRAAGPDEIVESGRNSTAAPEMGTVPISVSATASVPLRSSAAAIWHRLDDMTETLGRSSLFVYWIHVEMVYGLISLPLHRTLPLWASIVSTVALSGLLYRLVVVKNRALG